MQCMHIPPASHTVISLAVLNFVVAAIKFGGCWLQVNRRVLQRLVCALFLGAEITLVVLVLIMINRGISVTQFDQWGPLKLPKGYLSVLTLSCFCLEAYEVYLHSIM
jgi:hypothetical protein